MARERSTVPDVHRARVPGRGPVLTAYDDGSMDLERRTAVLVLSDLDRLTGIRPLIADLDASAAFTLEVSSDPERLQDLGAVRAVYADWQGGELSAEQERDLVAFVRRGGTLVVAG